MDANQANRREVVKKAREAKRALKIAAKFTKKSKKENEGQEAK